MTSTTQPLPVISLLNDVTVVQGYLRSVRITKLPPVILNDAKYRDLVTRYNNWRDDLWGDFWVALLAANVTPQVNIVVDCFDQGIATRKILNASFYDGSNLRVAAVCINLSNYVTSGTPILEDLEAIADTIEHADEKEVAKLTALVAKLDGQFDDQEEELTQAAIDSGFDLVATAVDLAVAVGTEGADIAPLIKSVIKVGQDVVDELVLTDEIKGTLKDLEAAWAELSQASADLAAIKLTCDQLKAVTANTSAVLLALAGVSDKWSTAAAVTDSQESWDAGSAALRTWGDQMSQVSFSYATQSIGVAQVAAF